jgi:hypothetical protein
MATTEHFYAGTGSQTSFPFQFPYLTESDVFVELYNSSTGNFDLKQLNTSGQNNDYSISNTNIVFNVAPPNIANVNNIHIYRNTDVETAKAVYGTGSAIRAQDLNDNTNQSIYKLQEGTQLINTDDIKDEAINSAKIKNETIVNADISPTAEIAVSKLANGTARQLLQTAANGTDVEFTSNIDVPGTLDVTGTATFDGNVTTVGTTTTGLLNSGNATLSGTLDVVNTIGTTGGLVSNNVRVGLTGGNEIDTSTGNLIIDSAGGTTTVDDNLNVTGDLTVTGSITAPLWNGASLDQFWLTNKQTIDHIGETITLGKSSTGTGSSYQVSNAAHRFSVAKDYTFEVGRYVNEGVNVGTLSVIGFKPCLEVKHLLEQTRVTKMGSSYSVTTTDEAGYINFGTSYSSWMGSNQNLGNTNIQHAHLVLSGIRGVSSNTAITNSNNYCPSVVISGQRGVMFTHPDNTTHSYTQGGSIYSGLNQLAKGSYSQGTYNLGDPAGFGNNGYVDASEALALFEAAIDFQIIVGGARAKNRFEIGSSSVTGTISLSGTDVTSTAAEINILDGVTSNTSELNKLDGFTGTTTDLNEVVAGKSVVEQISGSATDAQIPTAQAVNERVVELVTEVGGFHPIADETNFPTTNPDINDGAGTIVSLKALNSAFSTGSGVTTHTFTNGAGSGVNVIINGLPASTTFQAGKGLILETTTVLHTYNYHRLVLDESGVSNADALVSAFNERYYGPHAANQATRPSGANRLNGDLYFNTSDGKMKVFNGSHASGTWDDVAAPGNFFINTLSSSSGSGGGQAAFNGTATRFTLSNPPLTAQQLLVSVNGVIQKPNSGTSPSEGFAIDGADIIFSAPPALNAPFFIVTIGSSVNIGTPSDGTVTTIKLDDGAVTNAKVSSTAGIVKSKLAALEIVDADVNASAGIAKSKLASLDIVNADVNASAAIVGSKLANLVSNDANNRILTATGTTNSFNGESNLTYDGSKLQVATDAHTEGIRIVSTGDTYNDLVLGANRTASATHLGRIVGEWNGGQVASIAFNTGADASGKDDGFINFQTSNGGSSMTPKMTIQQNGNVGINTENPYYKLEVIGGTNGLYALGDSTTALSTSFGASSSHILRCENSELAIGLANVSPYNLYLQGRTNGSVARPISINPLGGDVAIGSNTYENIPLHVQGVSGQATIFKLKSLETTANQQWMTSGNALCLHQYDGLSFNTYTPSAAATPVLELQHQINHHGITLTQGKGINFYHYGIGTDVTANQLNDYEIGEWTPVLEAYDFNNSNTWTAVTFDDAPNYTKGRYTKIGNLVHVWWYTESFSPDPGYNNLSARIGGLPFPMYNVSPHYDGNFSFTHTTCFKDTAGNITQPSGGFISANSSYLNPMIPIEVNSARWASESGRYMMLSGTYATNA